MHRLLSFLRWIYVTCLLAIVLAIVAGVVGEFFIEVAREKGVYADPSRKLDAAMSAFSDFVTQTWFLVIAAAVLGLTIGLRLDQFLRRRKEVASSLQPSTELISDPEIRREHRYLLTFSGSFSRSGNSATVFVDFEVDPSGNLESPRFSKQRRLRLKEVKDFTKGESLKASILCYYGKSLNPAAEDRQWARWGEPTNTASDGEYAFSFTSLARARIVVIDDQKNEQTLSFLLVPILNTNAQSVRMMHWTSERANAKPEILKIPFRPQPLPNMENILLIQERMWEIGK